MPVDPAWLREQARKREAAQRSDAPAPAAPTGQRLWARPLLHVNDLSRPVRRRIALGTTFMAVGLVVASVPLAVVWLLYFVRSQSWVEFLIADLNRLASVASLFTGLPGIALWTVGFIMLCPRVPGTPRNKHEAQATGYELRGIMVGRPFFWPVLVCTCAACWALPLVCIVACVAAGGADTPEGSRLAVWGYGMLLFASITNAGCCFHLRELATVVCDDPASNRFLQTMFLFPLLVLLGPLLLVPPNLLHKAIPSFTLTSHGFGGIFMLVGCLAFLYYPGFRFAAAVWSLGASWRWSVTNDIERESKNARFVARSLEIERRAEEERVRLGDHARRDGEDPEALR